MSSSLPPSPVLHRVLYRSLLRAAKVYDVAGWSRTHLFAEPAIRQRLPSIEWFLGNSSCQQLIRHAFRHPTQPIQVTTQQHPQRHSLPFLIPSLTPSSPACCVPFPACQSVQERLTSAFAVLRSLRSKSYLVQLQSSAPSSASESAYDDEDDEGSFDLYEDEDEETAIASEAEALLDSADFDNSDEASLLHSALSHFGAVQLISSPHATTGPVLQLTLRARNAEGGDGTQIAHALTPPLLPSIRQKQRDLPLDEEWDEDEEEENDVEEEQRREAELADLHLTALTEAKADDFTLLSLHPFTSSELSSLHEQHSRLQAALMSAEVNEDEVDEAMSWFLASDAGVPRHLRLTNEDYHRILHHWMDREDYVMEEEEGEEEESGSQAVDGEEEEGEDDEEEDERSHEAREEEQSRLRLLLFARMKDSGYGMKRELVKRLMKEARREGGTTMALVLLRETAFGRLPPSAPSKLRRDKLKHFHSAMRGEHIEWEVNARTTPPRKSEPLLTMTTEPTETDEELQVDAVIGSSLRQDLLSDGPLLEMVIEASADQFYTEAVKESYPDALSIIARDRPPTPTSAHYFPLTPSTSPSALPHLALDLFSLMELHSIPFTRRSTVISLLYVCNELQLPTLASLVLRKAKADAIPLTSSLIDNLITIACNSYHLHLALQALTWYRPLKLEPPITSFATLFNFALYGEKAVVDFQIVDRWARGRGLVMQGWEGVDGEGGGGRSALLFALLEEAHRVGLGAAGVVREAQLVVSRELVRSMKEQLRDIGQWIQKRENGEEEEDEAEGDAERGDDDDDDDDHNR